MSNKSVLGAPASAPHLSRTAFPISQDFTFTASAGMLLPTFTTFLNYGEKISFKPRFFLRTNPLLAPAMADIDVYVDTFFVPMRHIYSMFDQWFTQVSDSPTDLFDESAWSDRLPVMRTVSDQNPFSWMTSNIFNLDLFSVGDSAHWSMASDTFGFGLHRLTQHLGYNAQSLFINAADSDYDECTNIVDNFWYQSIALNRKSPALPLYRFAAYQKIYMDVYRDSEWEENNVKAYNFDSYFNSGNLIVDPTDGVAAGSPLSAYKRLGALTLRYRTRNKDYFTAVHPSPLFNTIGMLPNALQNLSAIKNWLTSVSPAADSSLQSVELGLGSSSGGSLPVSVSGDLSNLSGTIDSDTWTSPNNAIVSNAVISNASYSNPSNLVAGATKLTDVQSSQYQSTAYLSDSSGNRVQHAHNFNGIYLGSLSKQSGLSADVVFPDTALTSTGSVSLPSADSVLNLASLRSAFALDKLLRVTNRAGRHVDDQIFAQFGVKVPQGVSNEVYRIKSYHTMVHLGEVVSTAQTEITDGESTSVTPLGEMAGRGVALLNDSKTPFQTFTAPVSGIFMSIFSIAPRYKYVGAVEKEGFHYLLNDFYRPQTDNLGQQPLFSYETGYDLELVNARTSWQWRNMESKIKFDRVSLTFLNIGDNPWSMVAPAPSPSSDIMSGDSYNPLWNKVNPHDLDDLFVAQYSGRALWPDTPGYVTPYPQFLANYLRDPFKVDFSMSASKISVMSRFGEPELGGL